MAISLDSLVVKLQLDAAEFERKLERSTNKGVEFGQKLKKEYKDLSLGIDVNPAEINRAERLIKAAIREIEREQKKLKFSFEPTTRSSLKTGIQRDQARNVQTIRSTRGTVGKKEESLKFLQSTLKETKANKALLSDLEKTVQAQRDAQVDKLAKIEKNTKPKKEQNLIVSGIINQILAPAIDGLSRGFFGQFMTITDAFGGFEGIGSTISSSMIKATNDLVIPTLIQPIQEFLARGGSISDIAGTLLVDAERGLATALEAVTQDAKLTEQAMGMLKDVMSNGVTQIKTAFQKIDEELAGDIFIGEEYRKVRDSRAVQTIANVAIDTAPIDMMRDVVNDLRSSLVKAQDSRSEAGMQALTPQQIQEQISTTKALIAQLKAQQQVFKETKQQEGRQLEQLRGSREDAAGARAGLFGESPDLQKLLDLEEAKKVIEDKINDFNEDVLVGVKSMDVKKYAKQFEDLQEELTEVTSQIEELTTDDLAMTRDVLSSLDEEISGLDKEIDKLSRIAISEGEIDKIKGQLEQIALLDSAIKVPVNIADTADVTDDFRQANEALKEQYQGFFEIGQMLSTLKGQKLGEGEAEEGLLRLKEIFQTLNLTDEVTKIEGFFDILDLVDGTNLAAFGDKLVELLAVIKDGVDMDIANLSADELASKRLELSGQLRGRSGVGERTERQNTVLTARIDSLNNNLDRLTKVFNQKIGAPDNAVFEEIARKLEVGVEGLNLPTVAQGGGDDVKFDVIGEVLTLNKEMIAALDDLEAFEKLPKRIQDSIVRAVMQTLGQTGNVNPLTGLDFEDVDTTGLDEAMERVKEVMDKTGDAQDVATEGLRNAFNDLSDAVNTVTSDFQEFDSAIKLPNSMSNLLENLENDLTVDLDIDAEKIKADLQDFTAKLKENFAAISAQDDPNAALQLIEEFRRDAEATRERLDAIKQSSTPEAFKQISRDLGQVKRQLTLLTKKLPDMTADLEAQVAAQAVPEAIDPDILAAQLAALEQDITANVEVDTSSLDDFDWEAYGEQVGENISDGLEQGLSGEVSTDFAQDIIDSAEDTLGIASPSKVFKEIGEFIIEGLNEGLSKDLDTDLDKQIQGLIEQIQDRIKDLEDVDDIDFSTIFNDLSTDDLSLLRVYAEEALSQVDWSIEWDMMMRGLDDAIAGNALDALDDVEDRMNDIRQLASEVGTREFSDDERQTLRQGITDFGIVDATGTEDLERQREIIREIFNAASDAQVQRLIFAEGAAEQLQQINELMNTIIENFGEAHPAVGALRDRLTEISNTDVGQNIQDTVDSVQAMAGDAARDVQQISDVFGIDLIGNIEGFAGVIGQVATKITQMSIRTIAMGVGIVNLFKLVGAAIGKVMEVVANFTDLLYDVGQNIDTFINLRSLEAQLTNVGLSMEYARGLANELAIGLEDVAGSAGIFDSLMTSLGEERGKEVGEQILTGLSNTGLDSQRLELAITAISQIASKGVVSMEELRGQLGESFPQALGLAADAMGLTRQQMIALVSSGQLMATDFLPAFAAELEKSISPMERLEATSVRFNSVMQEMRGEMGGVALQIQSTFFKVTGIEALINNAELLKTAVYGLGIAFTTLAVIGITTAAKLVLSIGLVRVALGSLLDMALKVTATLGAPVALLTVIGLGAIAVGKEIRKSLDVTANAEKLVDSLAKIGDKLEDIEKKGKKTRKGFAKFYNDLFISTKDRVEGTGIGGLDAIELTKQAEAVTGIEQEVNRIFQDAFKLDINSIVSQLQTLQGQKALIELEIADAESSNAPLEVIQALMRESSDLSGRIAALNQELGALPASVEQLRDFTKSDEFKNWGESAQNQLLAIIASVEGTANRLDLVAREANKLDKIFLDSAGFTILERKLEDINLELEMFQTRANLDGKIDLNTSLAQQRLNALNTNIKELDANLETRKADFLKGLSSSTVTALEKLAGTKIDLIDLDAVDIALSKLEKQGDSANESYKEIFEKFQEVLEQEDAIIDKRAEALQLEQQILTTRLSARNAQDRAGTQAGIGAARRQGVQNEIQNELSFIATGIRDSSVELRNAMSQYQATAADQLASINSISSQFSTDLQSTLLNIAGATGQSFQSFLANITSEQADNISQQLAEQVEDNPVLGTFLEQIGEVAAGNEELLQSNLSLVQARASLIEQVKESKKGMEEFNRNLQDTIASLEDQIAETELDTQLTNLSTTLSRIAPEQESIFGELGSFVLQAAEAEAEAARATMSYEQEIRSNAETVRDLTEQYSELINKELELANAMAVLTHNVQIAANNLAQIQAPAAGGTPTFALAGQTIDTATITSGFGAKEAFRKRAHTGTDFAAAGGTEVMSMFDGVVKKIVPLGDQMQVMVEHVNTAGEKVKLWYVHLGQGLDVVRGQAVKAGQALGEVAHTSADAKARGISTGDHLDIKIDVNGVLKDLETELPRQFKLAAKSAIAPAVQEGFKAAKPIISEITKVEPAGIRDVTDRANQANKENLEAKQAAAQQELINALKAAKTAQEQYSAGLVKSIDEVALEMAASLAEFDIGKFIAPTEGEKFFAKVSDTIEPKLQELFTSLGQSTDDLSKDLSTLEPPIEEFKAQILAANPNINTEMLQEAIDIASKKFLDARNAVGVFQQQLEQAKIDKEIIDAQQFDQQKIQAREGLANQTLDALTTTEQGRLGGGSKQFLLELEAVRQIRDLEAQRVEIIEAINLAKNNGVISEQEAIRSAEMMNERFDTVRSNIENSTTQMGQFAATAREGLEGALGNNLTAFFQNQVSGLEMLRGIALDVLNSIAAKAGELATSAIIDGLFGTPSAGGFNQGGGMGGGLIGGLMGLFFKDGGKVPTYPMGGAIPYAASGMKIDDTMSLGMGITEAMKREGAGAIPIVAHAGEWVLSDRTGDAQLYESLRRSGQWDSMKSVGNFEYGGQVGGQGNVSDVQSSPTRNRFGAKSAIVVNNTFNVKDYNSFNRSRDQIARQQKAELDRASKRG